jgi:hypothetical protein
MNGKALMRDNSVTTGIEPGESRRHRALGVPSRGAVGRSGSWRVRFGRQIVSSCALVPFVPILKKSLAEAAADSM